MPLMFSLLHARFCNLQLKEQLMSMLGLLICVADYVVATSVYIMLASMFRFKCYHDFIFELFYSF